MISWIALCVKCSPTSLFYIVLLCPAALKSTSTSRTTWDLKHDWKRSFAQICANVLNIFRIRVEIKGRKENNLHTWTDTNAHWTLHNKGLHGWQWLHSSHTLILVERQRVKKTRESFVWWNKSRLSKLWKFTKTGSSLVFQCTINHSQLSVSIPMQSMGIWLEMSVKMPVLFICHSKSNCSVCLLLHELYSLVELLNIIFERIF